MICDDTRSLQFILLSSKLHVNALHISLLSRGTLCIAFFNKKGAVIVIVKTQNDQCRLLVSWKDRKRN